MAMAMAMAMAILLMYYAKQLLIQYSHQPYPCGRSRLETTGN